jgi:hypothetical protein
MSGPVAWRGNCINFYNGYLLLLEEEYTDGQASRVYGNQWQRRACLMDAGKTLATVSWLVLGTAVFLVSAAGQLWVDRRMVSAGGRLPSGSRQPLVELADYDAARRLAVAVCVPDEMYQCKSSSDWLTDWLACRKYASLFAVASNTPPNGYWCCCGLCWLVIIVVGSHMAFNGTRSPYSGLTNYPRASSYQLLTATAHKDWTAAVL